MRSFMRSLSFVLVVVALMGCERSQPIYNVESNPVPSIAQKKGASEKIGSIIIKTALANKWLVDKTRPGLLRCSLKFREHTAVVDITYTSSSYSIQHVSSENLLEEGGMIHRKYNQRIHQLQDAIDRELSMTANGQK